MTDLDRLLHDTVRLNTDILPLPVFIGGLREIPFSGEPRGAIPGIPLPCESVAIKIKQNIMNPFFFIKYPFFKFKD